MKNKQINVKLTYAETSTLPRVVGRVICANRGKGLSLTQVIAQYELALCFIPKPFSLPWFPRLPLMGEKWWEEALPTLYLRMLRHQSLCY